MADKATPKVEPDARELADNIYTACLAKPEHSTWKQADLLGLGLADSVNTLMPALSLLMKENKFQSIQGDNGATWTVRGRSAASKYAAIKDPNAVSIYRHIENAGASGMWKQTLKKKLGLHDNVLEKALKALTTSKHIKPLKAARNTAKKTYVLYEIEPSSDVTGGAWFSEGDIDYELIETASQVIVNYVRKESWKRGPRLARVPGKKKGDASKPGEKRKRDEDDVGERAKKTQVNGEKTNGTEAQTSPSTQKEFDDHEEAAAAEIRARAATDNGRILVPYPAGYDGYPTAQSILDKIEESGVITKDLTVKDVQELLQRLVYDGQLEKMSHEPRKRVKREESVPDAEHGRDSAMAGRTTSKTAGREGNEVEEDGDDEVGYRWIRRPDSEWFGVGGDTFSFDLGSKMAKNGFSETPCSRCPVFRLCAEGGPVSASNCEYLQEWF